MSPITCSTLGWSISMSLRIPDLFEDPRTEHGCTDGFLPWKCITIASHRCCTCQQRSVFLGGWIESYAIWAVKTCWLKLLASEAICSNDCLVGCINMQCYHDTFHEDVLWQVSIIRRMNFCNICCEETLYSLPGHFGSSAGVCLFLCCRTCSAQCQWRSRNLSWRQPSWGQSSWSWASSVSSIGCAPCWQGNPNCSRGFWSWLSLGPWRRRKMIPSQTLSPGARLSPKSVCRVRVWLGFLLGFSNHVHGRWHVSHSQCQGVSTSTGFWSLPSSRMSWPQPNRNGVGGLMGWRGRSIWCLFSVSWRTFLPIVRCLHARSWLSWRKWSRGLRSANVGGKTWSQKAPRRISWPSMDGSSWVRTRQSDWSIVLLCKKGSCFLVGLGPEVCLRPVICFNFQQMQDCQHGISWHNVSLYVF